MKRSGTTRTSRVAKRQSRGSRNSLTANPWPSEGLSPIEVLGSVTYDIGEWNEGWIAKDDRNGITKTYTGKAEDGSELKFKSLEAVGEFALDSDYWMNQLLTSEDLHPGLPKAVNALEFLARRGNERAVHVLADNGKTPPELDEDVDVADQKKSAADQKKPAADQKKKEPAADAADDQKKPVADGQNEEEKPVEEVKLVPIELVPGHLLATRELWTEKWDGQESAMGSFDEYKVNVLNDVYVKVVMELRHKAITFASPLDQEYASKDGKANMWIALFWTWMHMVGSTNLTQYEHPTVILKKPF